MKYIYRLCLLFLCILSFNLKINAANKLSSSFSDSISATYNGTVTYGATIMNKKYTSNNDSGRAFCTRFWYSAPYGTCTATTWNSDDTTNKKIAVAIGAMITKTRSLSGGTPHQIDAAQYFYGEMAINYFLYNYNGKASANNVTGLYSWGSISSNTYFKTIYSAGTTAYKNYGKTTVQFTNQKISISNDGKTITGSATLRCYDTKGNAVGCSAQVKQTLTLQGKMIGEGEGAEQETLNQKVNAKYTRSNSPDIHYDYSYIYNLPTGKEIVAGEKVTGTFWTKNKVTYVVAQNYNCGSSYQSLTPNETYSMYLYDETTKKASALRAKVNNCSITVNKKTDNGSALKGAKFKLYSDSECTQELDSGTSNSSGVVEFSGLSAGTYYVKETQAPTGYDIDSNSIKSVTVVGDNDKDCTRNFTTDNFVNKKKTGKLKVLKVDDKGQPVVGAKIRIFTIAENSKQLDNAENLQEDMTEYDFINDSTYEFNYIKDSNGNDFFITTENPIQLSGLTIGETYYVYEESVPENSDYSIKKGSDYVEITGTDEVTITLENIHSNFKISKQDITTKKELPGAEIQILDSRGIEVEKWTSTNTPKEIKGLEDGEYTLVEITAPKGYKQAESIKFTIENGKLKNDADNILVMYDDIVKVVVPDTLSARNILIVIAGITIVGIGLGMFLYGVKRKDQI